MEAVHTSWSPMVRQAFSCHLRVRTRWPRRLNTCSITRQSPDIWVRLEKRGYGASSRPRRWLTRPSSFTSWRSEMRRDVPCCEASNEVVQAGEDPLCHEYVSHS